MSGSDGGASRRPAPQPGAGGDGGPAAPPVDRLPGRDRGPALTGHKRRSRLADFLLRLVKEKPLGAVGLLITLLLLFAGIFADFLAPYGMNDMHDDRLAAPSARYLLGTDNLGRDLLSRVIFGARVSMVVGLASSAVATVISVGIGMVSGYVGGKFDLIVQRFVDAVMSLPLIIIVAVIMSMVGQGMLPLIIVMGVGGGISGSRHSRGFTISVVGNAYVQAAAAIGAPTSRILLHHILPNIAPLIIVGFSMLLPGIILTEASLSFLGYGIPPPAPSWGAMLSGANRSYMFLAPWMVLWPGLALSVVVYGTHMFGDALRDLLDPRLRGGAGRYGVRQRRRRKVRKRDK